MRNSSVGGANEQLAVHHCRAGGRVRRSADRRSVVVPHPPSEVCAPMALPEVAVLDNDEEPMVLPDPLHQIRSLVPLQKTPVAGDDGACRSSWLHPECLLQELRPDEPAQDAQEATSTLAGLPAPTCAALRSRSGLLFRPPGRCDGPPAPSRRRGQHRRRSSGNLRQPRRHGRAALQ
jgi:hypothetical protein